MNSLFQKSLNELIEAWQTSPEPTTKITSYFPIYTQLFTHLRGKACVFIETGVLNGGSLFMWRRWLGDQARIIGIDLNPAAIKWQNSGFEIYIGDQGDPEFWRELLPSIGGFDVLLDDGGHQSFQQIVTTVEAISNAPRDCMVVIEDTHTSFMPEFGNPSANSFLEFAKAASDCLLGRSFGIDPNRFPLVLNKDSIDFFKKVLSIQFYEGIVSFQVNPNYVVPAQVITNKESGTAVDFRYDGKDCAQVEWPNLFYRTERTISQYNKKE